MGESLTKWRKEFFSNGPKVIMMTLLMATLAVAVALGMTKEITVIVGGNEMYFETRVNTVEDLLDENQIALNRGDEISVSLDSELSDGDTIIIDRAIKVSVLADGNEVDYYTVVNTVEDLFEAEAIEVGELDKVSTDLDEELVAEMEIAITRVEEELIESFEEVDFDSVVTKSNQFGKEETRVLQTGQVGQDMLLTRVIYEDGVEVARELISTERVEDPVDELIEVGTLSSVSTSRGSMYYTQHISAEATAYCSCTSCTGGGSGLTASGMPVNRDPNGYSTVAVDPNVIPLGTKLYIPGYGLAIAADTGGAIKGNKVDLFHNSHSEALSFGRQSIEVYVLKDQ